MSARRERVKLGDGDKEWRDIEFACDVPQGATFCNVILGNLDRTNGTFDFRNVSVKFR